MTPVLLGLSIAIKLSFSIIGKKIRNLATVCFLIDFFITFWIGLGLYFWLDERLRKYYIYEGHYMILIGFTLLLNSMFFLISTYLRSKKRKKNEYNYIIGIALMSVSTFVGLFVSSQLYTDTPLVMQEYIITFSVFTLFNIYLCVNSYFLIQYRLEKFYQHEAMYAFFCYWGDILFVFWYDLFLSSRSKKRKKKKKTKKNKNRKSKRKRKTKTVPK